MIAAYYQAVEKGFFTACSLSSFGLAQDMLISPWTGGEDCGTKPVFVQSVEKATGVAVINPAFSTLCHRAADAVPTL
jgi:hypothetical protein